MLYRLTTAMEAESMTDYDEDYYERGIETGKSCYTSYRWIPELTIPMAMTMVDFLGIQRGQSVLEIGCAKGFLVKALRLLYRDAWGYDISSYAITHCDPGVKEFCSQSSAMLNQRTWDFCIAKDVFEHIREKELPGLLQQIHAKKLFAVIPLGENKRFYAEANNFDKTHVICQPTLWWKEMFMENRWTPERSMWRVEGIKDSYYKDNPFAHGFFLLTSNK